MGNWYGYCMLSIYNCFFWFVYCTMQNTCQREQIARTMPYIQWHNSCYRKLLIIALKYKHIKGGHFMKKVFTLVTLFLILCSSLVYAGGDKNRGSKGQGSTGTAGGGATTQTRGN